tara:strand:+ start:9812 stop:10045 length:234 start_codon:yes stop_codon:yes gene_type:complete
MNLLIKNQKNMLPINYAAIVNEIHAAFKEKCTSKDWTENILIENDPKSSFWRRLFKKKETAGEPIGEPNCRTIHPNR